MPRLENPLGAAQEFLALISCLPGSKLYCLVSCLVDSQKHPGNTVLPSSSASRGAPIVWIGDGRPALCCFHWWVHKIWPCAFSSLHSWLKPWGSAPAPHLPVWSNSPAQVIPEAASGQQERKPPQIIFSLGFQVCLNKRASLVARMVKVSAVWESWVQSSGL